MSKKLDKAHEMWAPKYDQGTMYKSMSSLQLLSQSLKGMIALLNERVVYRKLPRQIPPPYSKLSSLKSDHKPHSNKLIYLMILMEFKFDDSDDDCKWNRMLVLIVSSSMFITTTIVNRAKLAIAKLPKRDQDRFRVDQALWKNTRARSPVPSILDTVLNLPELQTDAYWKGWLNDRLNTLSRTKLDLMT
jgi:hypothetical protein